MIDYKDAKAYQSYDFCKAIGCYLLDEQDCDGEECLAYQMHTYLRDNGQILEAGSELAKVVAETERLRVESKKWREAAKTITKDCDIKTNRGKTIFCANGENLCDMRIMCQILAGLEG